MFEREIRQHEMLVRVREFGAAYRDLFPAKSVAGKLFAAVGEAADELQRRDSEEVAGRHDQATGVESKQSARRELRRQVRAIALTAAATEEPALNGKFRADPARNDASLLAQARTFLERAKPFVETFVAHELPPNFLRQLQGAIEALEGATAERLSGRSRRAGARAGVESAMGAAVHAVKRLNAIVPNKLADPAAIARWNLARRVVYRHVGDQPAAVAPSSAPPDVKKPAA